MKHFILALTIGLLAATAFMYRNFSTEANAAGKPPDIKDQYIVVFQDDVKDPRSVANDMAKSYGLSIKQVYKNALRGYAAVIPPQAVEGIKHDPKVKYVALDQLVNIEAPKKPVGKPTPTPTITPTPTPTRTPTPTPTITPTPTSSPVLSLQIITPNGGEILNVGDTYKITWNSSANIDSVVIGYSSCSSCLEWISTGHTPNTGSFDWKVSVVNPTKTQYKIYILGYFTGFGSVSDYSDNDFAVLQPPTPTPTITPTPTPTVIPTPIPQIIPTGLARIGINNNKGTGIGVAVIDTGIDLSHPDLAGNIIANTNCVDSTKDGNDDNGHGSHVAGTIAALDNTIGVRGVTPEAKLLAVKVLNSGGWGTWSQVICGIDYVTANASTYNIKVANMSLGGSGSNDNNCGLTDNDPLHQAICNSRDQGITYAVSAGNSNVNASTSIPAAYDDAVITVSALADSDGKSGGLGSSTWAGPDDTFATFSNWGSIVDIGAPGVDIYSTWKTGAYNTISGTSMATPHVAGSVVLYLQSNPGSTWQQVKNGLINAGEPLNTGHTDPSGFHPEPVVKAGSL